ncbi:MAG: phage minor head protein [Candidatus Aminicenantales bacterium]
MATVNATIKRILKDKDRAIRTGAESMLDLLEELRRQTVNELGKAALTEWKTYHLNQMLSEIESQIRSYTSKARAEAGGLLDESWNLGKTLVDAPLNQLGVSTGFALSKTLLDTLKDFTFHKIEGLSESAWDKIRGELTLGVMGGKTPQEVAAAIGKNLDDPSIFGSIARRAEVITKTEMGRVFSTAAEKRMEDAAEYVDGLEKQWRHVGHPMKPRPSHLAADGQHVPVDEPFNIGGVLMMYPRDPAAPIEETINCG